MMYRIEKVLNHNTVMAIHQDDHKEVLIMGKGVGFGRKVAERIEVRPEDRLYSLQKYKERGGAKEIVKSIAPEFLEVTNAVLDEAEKIFGKIDRMVLFPLADHIAFAVKRIQNHEQISNPLTEDIRVLFHMEFKAAESIRPLLQKQFGIDIGAAIEVADEITIFKGGHKVDHLHINKQISSKADKTYVDSVKQHVDQIDSNITTNHYTKQ